MTGAEWLTGTDPAGMIRGLGRNSSKRKRRLFGCACCRRIWPLIPGARSRSAVATAEEFADASAGSAELDRARVQARAARDEDDDPTYTGRRAAGGCYRVTLKNAGDAAKSLWRATSAEQMRAIARQGHSPSRRASDTISRRVWVKGLSEQASLLRDILGNPFRHVSVDPS